MFPSDCITLYSYDVHCPKIEQAVDNIPAAVDNIPAAVYNIPAAVDNIPAAVDNIPVAVDNIPAFQVVVADGSSILPAKDIQTRYTATAFQSG